MTETPHRYRGYFFLQSRVALLCAFSLPALLFFAGCASDDDRLIAKLIAEEARRERLESARPTTVPAAGAAGSGIAAENPAEPLQPMQTPTQLTIQPESVVEITVAEDHTLSGVYEVNSASAISFRYVGLVFLGNMTTNTAAEKIRTTLEQRGFKTATVAVNMIKSSRDIVRVTGWVNQPTDLQIGPGSSILLKEALLRAGSLRGKAKGIVVKLKRNGLQDPIPFSDPVEVYPLAGSDGKPRIPPLLLRNNDWVDVSAGEEQQTMGIGEKRIIVLVLNHPSIVRFSNSEPCSIMNLMIKLGDMPKWADMRGVLVLRRGIDGVDEELKVDVTKVLEKVDPDKDVALENGDRVIVRERRFL